MRVLKAVLKFLARLLLALVFMTALWIWWAYPKRSVDGVFVHRAPFTFADVPKGRALSPAEVDGYARRLLAEMSLEEKVLQMSGDSWLWDFVGHPIVGRPWNAGLDRRLALPPLVYSDGPRGVGMGASTCFPVAMARAASWDRGLERRAGDVAGREVRGYGAHVWLAPCLNLLRHPLWGRAQETYGEDPYLVGEMAAASVAGAQQHNVMACAKHFALNSIEETRHSVDVRLAERTLREVYLPHFKRLVDADVAMVMSAYNKVNGDYCGESRHLLREILKDEWGFRGFVVSDWIDGAFDGVKAANAGLDLEMPMVLVYGHKLVAAVKGGRVAPAVVDDAVLRMLRRRIEYAARPDTMRYGPDLVRAPEHVAFTREAAEKSLVLLKNDGVLPLDRSRLRSLAVIGPLADAETIGDRGSSRVRAPTVVSLLSGVRAALGATTLVYEPGLDLAKARAAAQQADVALVVAGFNYPDEGEHIPTVFLDRSEWGGDRKTLGLAPADQARVRAVAAANPKTIVVLTGGAAITVEEWHAAAGAIVMAFYPGEQGGAALARILFGDVNPSGKLPFTVPKDASQLPPFDNTTQTVEYGPLHGYTLVDKNGAEPRYAFGYGLSYTTYRYAGLTLAARSVPLDGVVRAVVDVTNTGSRAGEEIVELYVGFPRGKVERPVKLLRGFEKIPLAPGETKRVSLGVAAKDLAYYDVDAKGWVVEPGEYQILVGPSSRPGDLLAAPVRISASTP
jgi:beta-glucosidase